MVRERDGHSFPRRYGAEAGVYAVQEAAVRLEPGAIGYTWYDLRNDGFDPKNAEHNYGMLDNEFYPKPVYSVYNMLAGLFREAQFRRQLEIGNGSWAFEFAVPGGILIPAWNESGATRDAAG